MALEDIFKALEEQGQAESAEVLAAARDQASSIADEAKREATGIRERRVEIAERAVKSANAQRLNSVRLEGKKGVASVKEAAVQEVFDAALDELAKLRGSAAYAGIFRSLAEEALKGVSGDIEVLVDPADEKIAKETLAAMGSKASVRTDVSTIGGIVVATDNGRIQRRNTLEDRLAKARTRAQAGVAGILLS